MQRIREEFDGDQVERRPVADYPATTSPFEIVCSVCGGPMYVDAATRREFQRVMEHELDNKFICDECEQEYDELAHP